jgi:hypothetical protein
VKDEVNNPPGGLRVSRVAGRLQFWGLESVCIQEKENDQGLMTNVYEVPKGVYDAGI